MQHSRFRLPLDKLVILFSLRKIICKRFSHAEMEGGAIWFTWNKVSLRQENVRGFWRSSRGEFSVEENALSYRGTCKE